MQRCRGMKKEIALLAGRWPSQPATRDRPSPNTSCIDAPGDPAPFHTVYRVAAPAALHAQPEIAREQRAGMRSETAVHRCLTEASAVEGDHWQAFPQLKAGVVGLAGLEPPASSLSAIGGSPLCDPASSQVAGDRKGRSNALLHLRPDQRTDAVR